LTDPAGQILAHGGQIFVALQDEVVVGTCAVVPHGPGAFEVAKLAVASTARGRGIGRQLIDACLGYARQRGARQAVLVSNSRLEAALRLYEQRGFRYAPLPARMPYATADVYMELELTPDQPAA
jgi:ribosomal protein S18 acetylase RimI-like enzyme